MSFFTSLKLYRPTPPPVIVGRDLAAFVRAFQTLGAARPEGMFDLEVKFGKSIDQDDKPTTYEVTVDKSVSEVHAIEWDVKETLSSANEVVDALGRLHGRVYRAGVPLGTVSEPVRQALNRVNSQENEIDLALDTWTLGIGPVSVGSLSADQVAVVGWIDVSLSGYGYLYPWTLCGLIERAEALPQVQRLMALCRDTWPVKPAVPPRRIQRARKAIGELWPYPRFDTPWDWYWSVSESG
ncbi:MAG: hypothetical protein FJ291_06240 [Planctomycetes bacterium]|nr:hypothetical protein [Planctomycetota bacterium]